jgi:hypothetical protein
VPIELAHIIAVLIATVKSCRVKAPVLNYYLLIYLIKITSLTERKIVAHFIFLKSF